MVEMMTLPKLFIRGVFRSTQEKDGNLIRCTVLVRSAFGLGLRAALTMVEGAEIIPHPWSSPEQLDKLARGLEEVGATLVDEQGVVYHAPPRPPVVMPKRPNPIDIMRQLVEALENPADLSVEAIEQKDALLKTAHDMLEEGPSAFMIDVVACG